MREILFRAKHIHALPQNEHLNGTWVYGYLCDENYINSPELEGEFLIDPETVCQYTGLTDKNGRKIFEGDIVRENVEDAEETGTDKFIYSVLYSEEHTAFTTSDVIGEGYFEPLAEYISGNAEVIGNIFDNPELIGDQP